MNVDIVLEGGGVKAIAQVGTAAVLEERGYRVHRAAGSSGGTLVAAGLAAGVPAARPKQLMDSLDYRRVPDATGAARLGLLGRGISSTPPGTLRNQVKDSLSLALAIPDTAVNGNDQVHLADPCVASRTIFVDTLGVSAEDFGIDASTRQALYENGRRAAVQFLTIWDWDTYLRTCGTGPGRAARARAARGEIDFE